MKRIVASALALTALSACEPTIDVGDARGDSRFSAPDAPPIDDEYVAPPEDVQNDVQNDEPIGDPIGDPVDDGFYGEPMAVRAGFLRGAVGPIDGLADDANELQGTAQDGWTTVTTTVSDESRLAMTIVEMMGDLDMLEPGKPYRYDVNGYAAQDVNAPWLAIIGCAADDPDEGLDFDQAAEEVVITVDAPDEASLDVQYDAVFVSYDEYGRPTGESIVHGRFSVDR